MTTPNAAPPRSAGLLLHPTSLPGPFGVGDLGPAAYAWIDTLVEAKQRWWQILPLGPTGFGDSPYQCFSAFAGNPFLVSPLFLRDDGLVDDGDLRGTDFPDDHVDFGPVIEFKNRLLDRAWERFKAQSRGALRGEFETFTREQAGWLDDYALFMALKDAHHGASWQSWPNEVRLRNPLHLADAKAHLADGFGQHQFRQFLFFRQWRNVKNHARQRGVGLIGDLPIFVSSDSADVWANPEIFLLDTDSRPTHVAGVPPDYFSATGQLWGNPLYRWDKLQATGFAWWLARFRAAFQLVDLVRLDHFRGFETYWQVGAHEPTAMHGHWVKAPGAALFDKVRETFGRLPIIAEDLGTITPEVEALRLQFGLPGMRILQFAFGESAKNPYLPHNYDANTVVYTGTHDNDTTWGWFSSTSDADRDHVRRYLARDGGDIAWDLIRAAWASTASWAVAPLQDVLNLGSEARMNFPGKPQGNWSWRFQQHQIQPDLLGRLADLTTLYGRI